MNKTSLPEIKSLNKSSYDRGVLINIKLSENISKNAWSLLKENMGV